MDEDEFQKVVNNQFGQMESVMGQDGYKAFVEARNAEGDGIKAFAAKNVAITSAIRVFTLIGFMVAIPVIVWLWRWALS